MTGYNKESQIVLSVWLPPGELVRLAAARAVN